MNIFLLIYQQLLPRATAWSTVINKQLRQFIDGLTDTPTGVKEFADNVYDDIFPQTTRDIDAWEQQFGLSGDGTEQERRDAIASAWQALGGQSPRYLQDTLQAAGFDVYVHDWWIFVGPVRVTINPFTVLDAGIPTSTYGDGETDGNGLTYGAFDTEEGYPLVNRSDESVSIPNDPDLWPFFNYVGGEIFPTLAQVPADRKTEFETLLLKTFPQYQWIGVLVEYV
jgi:hypothetical protein